MTPTKPIVLILALSSLIFAALMPPEAFPVGKMGVIVCATFSFLIALSERRIPSNYVVGGLALLGALVIHSIFISVDMHRSLEFITVLWAYYCLLGFFMYTGRESVAYFAGVMVILTVVVSLYGLYQYFWGFDQMRTYIVYSVSGQADKASALGIIGRRRVFSTLVLPGTLWGFLLTALPLHALLWNKRRIVDVLLVVCAVLLLITGALTQSFGFVLGLLVLLIGYLYKNFGHTRRIPAKAIVTFGLLIAAAGAFYVARRGMIDESNPLLLRAKNFVSAWNIFVLNPWGSGLNTFGVLYPQYMQPKANETQFAHNTPLQIMSELGYVGIAALLVLIFVASKTNRIYVQSRTNLYLLLALGVWIVHNLIDINVYFPSIGVLGAILIGALFARPRVASESLSRPVVGVVFAFALVIVLFSGLNLVSSELEHRAQIEYENGKPLVALETLENAQKFSPLNSVVFEDAGEILLDLHYKQKDPEFLKRATASFQRAIELSPVKADPHIWYALCLSAADNLDSALHEIRLARHLFPSSDRIPAIIRLLEKRQ